MDIKAKVKSHTIKARVFRVSTGKWEDLGIIATSKADWYTNLISRIKELWRQS